MRIKRYQDMIFFFTWQFKLTNISNLVDWNGMMV